MPISNGSCNGTSGISLAGSREDTGTGRGDAMSVSEDFGPDDAAADAAADAVADAAASAAADTAASAAADTAADAAAGAAVVTAASASLTDAFAAKTAPGGPIFGEVYRPHMPATATAATSAVPSKPMHTAVKATTPSWMWRAKGSGGTGKDVGKRGG